MADEPTDEQPASQGDEPATKQAGDDGAGKGRRPGGAGRLMRALRHLGTAAVVLVAIVSLLVFLFGPADAVEPAVANRSDAAASLHIIDPSVTFRGQPGGDFVPATDQMPLEVGDSVRTDDTGFAQIDWSDGSLARLDVNTEFEVLALAGDALAPEIRAGLDVGRVWNRVQSVTGSTGRYEVETAVGVAAVRGTGFSIACTIARLCTFIVAEGFIELTTADGGVTRIDEGESIVVGPSDDNEGVAIFPPGGALDSDGDGTPDDPGFVEVDRQQSSPDDLRNDPWIGDNLDRDDDSGRFGAASGNCTATVDGRNAKFATSPDRAIEVDVNDAVPVLGRSVGPITSYDILLSLAGLEFNIGNGVRDNETDWQGSVAVDDYAIFGVGLYEVGAESFGTPCRIDGYVLVTGRSPLATAGGLSAALIALIALAVALGAISARHARQSVFARRLRGLVMGVLAGVGIAILLQQYGAFPLTGASIATASIGTGVVTGSLPRGLRP